MDEKKLKKSESFCCISFSDEIVVEQVYCTADNNTIFQLRIGNGIHVTFSIVGTNPNTVLKTLFGALYGYSRHLCIHDMVVNLRDIYDVKHINLSYHYEKD